jgi:hypothetical protein
MVVCISIAIVGFDKKTAMMVMPFVIAILIFINRKEWFD